MALYHDETYQKLLTIRKNFDLKLKPNPYLAETFTGLDGQEHPFNVRNYQVQMVLHLLAMKRFVIGDDCGLGKTIEIITGLTYVWANEGPTKTLILTTKSAVLQWAAEFAKFTKGVTTYVYRGTPKQRAKIYKAWQDHKSGPCVLISNYRLICSDFTTFQNWKGGVLIADEATAFKNTSTQVFKVIRHLASQSSRVWGATATLIKNSLMEGYSIYQVIVPGLFPSTMNKFMTEYCVLEMMSIPGRAGKIPKVVGYLPSKVVEFRNKMDPFYLGRPKHDVASELPTLTTKIIEVGLSEEQEAKYADAVAGILTVKQEEKEVSKLTSLIYCQQIVNDLSLIGAEGTSDKVETLVDLLTGEGEFADDKVILFTRFKSMVDVVEKRLKKEGLKVVRVTGDEKDTERQEAQKQFQDFKSGVNVICITMAGGDAINLQAAKAVIFIDTPWSAGDLIQIVGRMIRVGSLHANAYSVHLVAKRLKGSIDQHVMKIMGKKMQLLEKVLGKRIKEEGDDELIESSRDIDELYESLKGDIIG